MKSRSIQSFIVVLMGLLCISVASAQSNAMMFGSQSGKSLYFVFSVFAILLLIVFAQWLNSSEYLSVKISNVDVFVALFLLYILLLNNSTGMNHYFPFFELIALYLWYAILRVQSKTTFVWLFLACIAGGLVQSVHGIFQLFDWLPSQHKMFSITGSFFNPGPYAGYLAIVFPALFGFLLFGSFPGKVLFNLTDSFKVKANEQHKKDPFVRAIFSTHLFYNNKQGGITTEQQVQDSEYIKLLVWRSFLLISFILMILILPASGSRASILAIVSAALYLFEVRFQLSTRLKLYFPSLKKNY
jgi:hypothetical protein